MGKSKEYFQDLRAVCIMPNELYNELKDFKGLYRISVYDNNMRQHYKDNEEWQELDAAEKLARHTKKQIEANIDYINTTK